MLHLRYKETSTQRVNRRSSLTMHDTKDALTNMRKTAIALASEHSWYSWCIVDDNNKLIYGDVIVKNEMTDTIKLIDVLREWSKGPEAHNIRVKYKGSYVVGLNSFGDVDAITGEKLYSVDTDSGENVATLSENHLFTKEV